MLCLWRFLLSCRCTPSPTCAGTNAWISRAASWTPGPTRAWLAVWSASLTPPSPSQTALLIWRRKGACIDLAGRRGREGVCIDSFIQSLSQTQHFRDKIKGPVQRLSSCSMTMLIHFYFYYVYLAGTMHNKNISLIALRNDVAPDLANSYFPSVVPRQVNMDTSYTKQAT